MGTLPTELRVVNLRGEKRCRPSSLGHLYQVLPELAAPYVLADPANVVVKPPVWGDASGVRGAAWLWE